eukprot:GHVN01096308.1.p1 GENE.GHVN01096308.1~~GHVN01096308.1.p1  ORF type:complete len:443 (-),score=160.44 GHVN01096308.1:541-1869(-)
MGESFIEMGIEERSEVSEVKSEVKSEMSELKNEVNDVKSEVSEVKGEVNEVGIAVECSCGGDESGDNGGGEEGGMGEVIEMRDILSSGHEDEPLSTSSFSAHSSQSSDAYLSEGGEKTTKGSNENDWPCRGGEGDGGLSERGERATRVEVKDYEAVFDDGSPRVRSVAVDFGTDPEGSVEEVIKATSEMDVFAVFCNAGYIRTRFFADDKLGHQISNFNCNAAVQLPLVHHFINTMRRRHPLTRQQLNLIRKEEDTESSEADPPNSPPRKGLIVFTSSPASLTPTPFTVMYGATKAFLTHLGTSLAAEVNRDLIDILVCNPSPTNTNFYDQASLDSLEIFKSTSTEASTVARVMFNAVGKTTIVDQGYYSFIMNLLHKVIDMNLVVDLIAAHCHRLNDYNQLKKAHSPQRTFSTTSCQVGQKITLLSHLNSSMPMDSRLNTR